MAIRRVHWIIGAVLLVLLALAAISLVRPGGERLGKTRRQLAIVGELLKRWHEKHGDFPDKSSELLTLLDSSIPDVARKRLLLDGWGRPLVYRRSSERKGCQYDLYSAGENGTDDHGSNDDVVRDDNGYAPGC
jgi:hypothetical protein